MGHGAQWGASALGLRCDLLTFLLHWWRLSLYMPEGFTQHVTGLSAHTQRWGINKWLVRELQLAQNQVCFSLAFLLSKTCSLVACLTQLWLAFTQTHYFIKCFLMTLVVTY